MLRCLLVLLGLACAISSSESTFRCRLCMDEPVRTAAKANYDATKLRMWLPSSTPACRSEEGRLSWVFSKVGCFKGEVAMGDNVFMAAGPLEALRTINGFDIKKEDYRPGILVHYGDHGINFRFFICQHFSCFEHDMRDPRDLETTIASSATTTAASTSLQTGSRGSSRFTSRTWSKRFSSSSSASTTLTTVTLLSTLLTEFISTTAPEGEDTTTTTPRPPPLNQPNPISTYWFFHYSLAGLIVVVVSFSIGSLVFYCVVRYCRHVAIADDLASQTRRKESAIYISVPLTNSTSAPSPELSL